MSSVSATALQGIRSGLSSIADYAEQVSRVDSNTDLVSAFVGIKLASFQVEASAVVIKKDEELNQSVLDILA
jgi:hypothetical protein